MDLLLTGFVAGVVGTLAMDALNLAFARVGWISKIEVRMIGRMATGWLRGRFFYSHPDEMEPVAKEKPLGLLAHYAIGLGLAVPFVLVWGVLFGQSPPSIWTFVYGVATTAASWFFVYPSMGFGAFGLRSPEGAKATLSSLANHVFYSMGLVAGVLLT
jgi:hypothetical protein